MKPVPQVLIDRFYLNRAKSKGISKKYLTRYEMDEPTFNDFASALNTLGEIP